MKKRLYSLPTCEAIDLTLQQVLCESLRTEGFIIDGDIDDDDE